jgi:AcrR family transcriptional regulator
MTTARAGTADRSPRLTREEIALRALELADADGLKAVTMRRVAEHVGLPTMTLYGSFATKEELLDAMADAAVALEDIAATGSTWRERLTTLMTGVKEALDRHPSGVHIRESGPVLGPSALRISEQALEILAEAGFSRRDASFAYRSIFLFTFGHAAFNLRDGDTAARRRVRGALASLPDDEFPALTTGIDDHLAAASGNATFRFGLELILDGLESRRGS